MDESRHFVRACQIAQGGWLSEIDTATGRGGGVLPEAVANFVRHWMDTDSLRSQDALHTIRERMRAIESDSQTQASIAKKRFVEFPSAGIYPPSLYIPQSIGIRVARFFSDKVYVWFYSARIWNAVCAVFLIFLALRIAPQHHFLLMLPAVLPMSLVQIASLSNDASIIALTILFVALCIRFLVEDNFLIRLALVLCLFLLVTGKPVHLALGVLLLTAHKRLGWRRAVSFCSIAVGFAVVSYFCWSYLVRPFIALAGEGHGQNPSAQVRFIIAHPILLAKVVLSTLKHYGPHFFEGTVGALGSEALSLPTWFYFATGYLIAAILLIILLNFKEVALPNLVWGSFAGAGLVLGVLLAGYVLWNPPAASKINQIQGRYFLPALPLLAFIAPPLSKLSVISRIGLTVASIGYLLLSVYLTVRIVDHYYFPRSTLLGKNVHSLFSEVPDHSCPASLGDVFDTWLELVISGRTEMPGNFRVLVTAEDGTVLGESDPVLAGADFPYVLLPGSSRSRWRVHMWYINKNTSARLWLIHGNSACSFGPKLHFKSILMPDA
jgi:uncharacterized membrane protein